MEMVRTHLQRTGTKENCREGNKMKMEKKLKEEGIKWGQKQDKTEEKGEK